MKHKYTEEQGIFIIDTAFGKSRKEITEIFNQQFGLNLGVNQIAAYLKNHKVNTGLTGRFETGHIPFTKGKKGITTGGIQTQFKKGQRPVNYMPLGSERINGDGYVDIKIADPNKWKAKHKIIWEKHNGDIPKGKAIIFGDRDNRNFDINNLILVSKRQLLILNQKKLIQSDADLTRTGVIIADLYSKIHKIKSEGC